MKAHFSLFSAGSAELACEIKPAKTFRPISAILSDCTREVMAGLPENVFLAYDGLSVVI